MRLRISAALVLAVVLSALALAGCGGSSGSSSSSSTSTGDGGEGTTAESGDSGSEGLEAGDKKEIAYFALGLVNQFVIENQKGLEKVAGEYGYQVKSYDGNFEQTKLDSAVQQFVGSGKQPAGIVWQPVEVGGNSATQLSQLAPVLQISQGPKDEGAYGYWGGNQVAMGEGMGELALQAREQLEKEGVKLHGPHGEGNVLYLDINKGQPAGPQRMEAFDRVTKSKPFNIVDHEYGSVDPESGYEVANVAIPRAKAEGIDIVVTFTLGSAKGVRRAMEQNGLEPGGSTLVVAGDCGSGGEPKEITEGKIFGAVFQSGLLEGEGAARNLIQRIATGEVKEGVEETLAEDATLPPLKAEAPPEILYQPAPLMTKESLESGKKVYGHTLEEGCLGE